MLSTLTVAEIVARRLGRGADADALAARITALQRSAAERGEKLPAPPLVRLPGS